MKTLNLILFVVMSLAFHYQTQAQDKDELSKQLANPIAPLISILFQNNLLYEVEVNKGLNTL